MAKPHGPQTDSARRRPAPARSRPRARAGRGRRALRPPPRARPATATVVAGLPARRRGHAGACSGPTTPRQRMEMTRIHPAGVFEASVPAGHRVGLPPRGRLRPARPRRPPSSSTTRTGPGRPSASSTCTCSARAATAGCGQVLGAHPRVHEGVAGVAFAVWAPNARAVRVVGDWNFWDGRVHQMRSLGVVGGVGAVHPRGGRRAPATSTS